VGKTEHLVGKEREPVCCHVVKWGRGRYRGAARVGQRPERAIKGWANSTKDLTKVGIVDCLVSDRSENKNKRRNVCNVDCRRHARSPPEERVSRSLPVCSANGRVNTHAYRGNWK